MKINKKILGVIIFILALIFVIIGSFILKEREDNKKTAFDLLEDDNDMQSIEVDITYDKDKNKYVYDMNGEEVEIDNGADIVLASSYIDIDKRYSILEVLIGLEGNKGYLNDAQLSTSYDFCSKYAKKWYLVDKETKEEVLLFDNGENSLLLNTKKGDGFLEADFMYLSLGEGIADHVEIPFEDIIKHGIFKETLNVYKYSIFTRTNLDFNPGTLINSKETKIDLDGDKKEDNISIYFYGGYPETRTVGGFEININDKSQRFALSNPNTVINVIDLDKNDKYKELLIGSFVNEESEDFQTTYIISFVNGEIVETFYSTNINKLLMIDDEFDFKEKELMFDDNGYLSYEFFVQDSIQNWHLKASYKLNEAHKLVAKNKDYFEAFEKSIRTITNNIDVVLYEEMDFSKNKIIVESGSQMKMIGTNLNNWGVIEYNENIYYLPIDGRGNIKGLDAATNIAFDGLAWAD